MSEIIRFPQAGPGAPPVQWADRGSAAARAREFGEGEFAALVAAAYTGFLAVVCARQALDFLQCNRLLARSGENTLEPEWRRASDARALAMYLLNTVCNVPQGMIARAVGLTAAAVCIALPKIEERREDPAFDAELTRIDQAIRAGRG